MGSDNEADAAWSLLISSGLGSVASRRAIRAVKHNRERKKESRKVIKLDMYATKTLKLREEGHKQCRQKIEIE
jgi:hypothetical protein